MRAAVLLTSTFHTVRTLPARPVLRKKPATDRAARPSARAFPVNNERSPLMPERCLVTPAQRTPARITSATVLTSGMSHAWPMIHCVPHARNSSANRNDNDSNHEQIPKRAGYVVHPYSESFLTSARGLVPPHLRATPNAANISSVTPSTFHIGMVDITYTNFALPSVTTNAKISTDSSATPPATPVRDAPRPTTPDQQRPTTPDWIISPTRQTYSDNLLT